MGHTVIEKIFMNHSSDEVRPGNIVWLDIDTRTARDFGGPNVVKRLESVYGEDVALADPLKTYFTFDCVVPANNIPYANNQQLCRVFAREKGMKVFDVDSGIGSHVAVEQGLCWPGSIYVGTDSHLNILGAVGCFGQGMGDADIAFAFKTGRTWFEVPETIKVTFKGEPYQFPVTAKDLTLWTLRNLGSRGALGCAVEFTGDVIDTLSMHERITLSSMVTEMGGIIGFIQPNEKILNHFQKVTGNNAVSMPLPDADAVYSRAIEIDIAGLKPQIACPPKPDNVKDVEDVAGRPVNGVFIGSCTNGRVEDFHAAAKIFSRFPVHEGVMAKAVPATKGVFGELLADGTIATLYNAGVIISNPGCGGCASGQIGMTGKGEVQISTSNRNFRGKQGDGDTYLASPVVAAVCAVTGKITDPVAFLKEGVSR
ncbi:MAG: homoaconitate hydratase family protein [Acidobacteria bacterium]|nr:MAG: homoaconitate hydratase family protein [Acidobacteriota bacterium]